MTGIEIIIGIVFIYILGRSHGKDKLRNEIRDIFTDRKGRR